MQPSPEGGKAYKIVSDNVDPMEPLFHTTFQPNPRLIPDPGPPIPPPPVAPDPPTPVRVKVDRVWTDADGVTYAEGELVDTREGWAHPDSDPLADIMAWVERGRPGATLVPGP